jgi:hypothetical protein
MATDINSTPISDQSPRAVKQAIDSLEQLEPSPEISQLLADLQRLPHYPDSDDESELSKRDRVEAELDDHMVELDRLSKSENLSPADRERARKAASNLQLKHLGRSNPRAAHEWIRQHAAAA